MFPLLGRLEGGLLILLSARGRYGGRNGDVYAGTGDGGLREVLMLICTQSFLV